MAQIDIFYRPSVFGKGYIGVGKYSRATHKTLNNVWRSMLRRCYDPKYHEKRPTYIGTIVCEEWLNFQVFAEWAVNRHVEGYDLDKDLLYSDNKCYSPKTCLFIPKRLNAFLTNIRSDNTSGYVGVNWDKQSKKWRVQIRINNKKKHLGYFTDQEKASEAYKEARAIEAANLKELYKCILPLNALDRIA